MTTSSFIPRMQNRRIYNTRSRLGGKFADHPVRKAEVVEREAVAFVEFVVEFHPVQPQSVQEALHCIHAQ